MDLNNIDNIHVRNLRYFERYYEEIWKTYKRYGEQVLEVDLGDTEKELKKIFLESEERYDFLKKLAVFWRNKYQIIIQKPSDVPKAILLEKTWIVLKEDEKDVVNSLVLVSKEFFEKLKENSSKDLAYILEGEYLYIVSFGVKHEDAFVELQDVVPINNILKD